VEKKRDYQLTTLSSLQNAASKLFPELIACNRTSFLFTGENLMGNAIDFTFSDLIAGYVTEYDATQDAFSLKTSDNREYTVYLTPTAYAELLRNLGEAYQDATAQMREMLVSGRFLFAYGIFYPEELDRYRFEAKHIVFLGRTQDDYSFEKQDWWIDQIEQLANFYIKSNFGIGDITFAIDYAKYRTNLSITGEKQKSGRQETDTISRLVYGFASAYLLTGKEIYLEAASKGTQYLQEHMRFQDKSEGIVYWYHGVDIKDDGTEQKIFASEFGDDYYAIPCYEQIYALAGPIQTYRITGDPGILEDAKATISLFHRFFKDKTEQGGYFSHIDPITLSPYSESLGRNKARKNWNSIGDHAPAYLINLWLATGKKEYADFLEYTFDTIVKYFPDYEESPFVQEKFFEDWSKDQSWGWQQNRAVIGHNLKIAWNLTRMSGLKPKPEYKDLAEKIGIIIPDTGTDRQRGGWYDVVERVEKVGKFYKYVWHDRKAWWQQEQGILAYYIMAGVYNSNSDFLRYAREGNSFYNAWFLDHCDGGVYFNVLANGKPYALGTERDKGSHSMSGYHSFELCYLAAVYQNLLIKKEPMDFYFKPLPQGFPDNILRVAPDILPPGSVKIKHVWINGHPYHNFDAEALTVKLPQGYEEIKVKVQLYPTEIDFEAELVKASDGTATVELSGVFAGPLALKEFDEEFEEEKIRTAKALTLVVKDLTSISDEGLRKLAFYLQEKIGKDFSITAVDVQEQVKEALDRAQLSDQIKFISS
jgi:mannose/cellobiose epimerase-like protein (N-acyl-D-glucosamine 2-epimerase family)